MSFGSGFGKLGARGRAPAQKPKVDHSLICEAISEKSLLSAKFEGGDLIMAPYAVFKSEQGTPLLWAVVLSSSNAALNRWEPQSFPVSGISDTAKLGVPFTPSSAFDSAAPIFQGGLICAVDPV